MTQPTYIPLRLHTEFSITDGMVRIKKVVAKAQEYGLPALGISDLMNEFGLVKFYKACRSAGIKPIGAADVWIENPAAPDKPFRAMLVIRNDKGYLRLNELLTAAYVGKDRNVDHAELRQSWLDEGDNSGLICLSGAHYGEVGVNLLNGHEEAARAAALKYAAWFPDAFYLELQRLPERPEWESCVSGSVKLAGELDLPVVATHPAQFMSSDDFQAHEARVCIAGGWVLTDKKRPRDFVPGQYFIPPETMAERFADLPEALENTVEIAKRCNLHITLGKNFLPDFPTPDGMSLNDYLTQLSNEGLRERMMQLYPDEAERAAKMPEYQQRLDFELGIIIQMGFPGYFLIVQDFINWAKQNGCPVGPGRGSGAGSLVAYSLKITDLDPLKYALLFERFLNPERVSMPDFDVDFCQSNRGRVIEYVREKYGAQAVSQIVTFGTMSSKAVIRDVGRVLELPFGLCDKLSKLIPLEANKPLGLDKAMEAEPQIRELIEAEEAEELIVLAKKLEDLTRGLGMHAGGVLIAPGKISDYSPVYQADESASPVSMYDKGDVEDVGLVKFDFLGLRNLTIIEMAQENIKNTTGDIVDVGKIPLDDQAAYKIFRDANTTAVFQFESTGMKKMLKTAHTTKFEELIAFVSLYRPGPMDNIPDFVARMKGSSFEYIHPLLQTILEPTYGIMVYQEQVMQAAQIIGGYSLGGADLLRRAMGKKKPEEMVKHREIFAEGAAKQGISREKSDEIFDYMEKFAGYGFNKSHAAAYALISYQTAWLKAHYTAEFMAATMSSELDNTDQLKHFYDDCRTNGVEFLPPDINESDYRFTPLKDHKIRYALGAIKGTGEAAVESIIAARKAGGKFTGLLDFCERVGKEHMNRRTLEALIRGGAFDSIEPNRAMLLANIDLAMDNADQKAANANQGGLFDMMDDAIEPVRLADAPMWSESEKLAEEKTVIGFYLSGHPFGPYAGEVRQIAPVKLGRLKPQDSVRVAGFCTAVRTMMGKRGKIAFVTLEDQSGQVEIMVSGQTLENSAEILKADQVLIIESKISRDDYGGGEGLRIMANQVMTLQTARQNYARSVSLSLTPEHDIDKLVQLLRAERESGGGLIPLLLSYSNGKASGKLKLPSKWRIKADAGLFHELEELLGNRAVRVNW
ncbi:DNA polymerase III subunit alpha [Neisseria animalis]|uniref:DNA polymerase III subunit alpha n=1 Tax=Neisseria animalis TaxID=492 RepID=A0A5P3MTL3_NEIAN|nr:DNA polymerase III subunit alpha [Neisseria animalis]QEY24111.1 DNA polymerase III subunit alpha [Neisseria animalis]ROW32679.1 DNA polymerase III subunit alpha [Neisseria animalis]VEE06306.1 DNA polymerase III subunit alpha [Neisseria animalis]